MSDSQSDYQNDKNKQITNKLNHTKNLGNKQFQNYLKSQPSLANLIFSIEKYLQDHSVSSFYLSSILILNKGLQIDIIKNNLNQQYQSLLKGKSFWHKINNAIISRQKCIEKIKRSLQKSQQTLRAFKKVYYNNSQSDNVYMQFVEVQGYSPVQIDQSISSSINHLNVIFIDMSRLRDMTIYIVQQIHLWKTKVQEKADKCGQHKPIYFLHNQQNFYNILQKDITFIWNSKLSSYILMQDKSDPLLIRNVVKIQKKQQKEILQKYFLEIMYPKSQQIVDKAIRCLQMLIYKYIPKAVNIFQQEEALIQNYLNLQRKIIQQKQLDDENFQIEYDLNNQGLSRSKISKKLAKSKLSKKSQENQAIMNWELKQSKVKQKLQLQKQTKRGWIFGKQLKPAKRKIKDIVEKHQNQMDLNFKNQMRMNLNMKTNSINFSSKPSQNHLGGYPHIKPFSIANFGQRKQLSYSYASQSQQQTKKKYNTINLQKQEKDKKLIAPYTTNIQKRKQFMKKISRSKSSSNKKYSQIKQISQQDQISIQTNKYQNNQNLKKQKQRLIFSQDEKNKSEQQDQKRLTGRMFQSLTKINPIIYEDPYQSQHDTPKRINKNNTTIMNNFFSAGESGNQFGRQHSISKVKINTFNEKLDNDLQKTQIQIDNQQTPLDMKQFFEVFRPDTDTKYKQMIKNNDKQSKKKDKEKRSSHQFDLTGIKSKIRAKSTTHLNPKMRVYSIKDLIQKRKLQRQQNLQTMQKLKKFKLPNKKYNKNYKNNKSSSLHKSRSLQKSANDSFKQYVKVQSLNITNEEINFEKSRIKQIKEPFISLKSKTIPYDMIGIYVRHIISLQPLTSKSFTSYNSVQIQKMLQDPYLQCFIFDLHAEGKGHIGQVILSESLGNRRGLLRYKIQFLNVNNFQLVIGSVSRIAQELLSSTPCQQFLCPFVVDKLDPVSTHFIKLIDQGLKEKAQKFATFHILQKKKFGYKGQDMYQRIYMFNAKKNKIKQATLGIKMMGNYRSISFETKCLLMASNFKLRSKSFSKSYITHFKNVSLGSLFIRVFQNILTKNHLKQIKTASMSLNDGDQMVNLVKHSSFLRNVIHSLILYMKNKDKIKQTQGINVSKFNSIVDMISYLGYKQYNQYFHFQFLEESKFILNHELVLSQFSSDVSLQFMITTSADFLLLGNYRNLSIEVIKSQEGDLDCYILPTTQQKQKLLLMSGNEYLKLTNEKLDLFSYMSLFLRNQKTRYYMNNIPQIVIPNLSKKNAKINKIKMYQGLYRLFQQRQFYTGTMFNVINQWEGYYESAVVRLPHINGIVIQYPIIVGFYNADLDQAEVAFLLNEEIASP